MRLVKRLPILLLASLFTFAACGADDDPGEPCTDPVGDNHTYVIDGLALPATPADAQTYALDIDGDAQGRVDNALGNLLATLAAQGGVDLVGTVDEAVLGGDIALLVNLVTTDFQGSLCTGLTVYLADTSPGAIVPDPCTDPNDPLTCGQHLDGNGQFSISADSPRDASINGRIVAGKFSLGPDDIPGQVSIQLDLIEGGDPLEIGLVGARAEISNASETGLMGGLLGGAITEQDLDGVILPAVHGLVVDALADDCQGAAPDCCDEGSTGATLVDIFDANDDCVIDLEEITSNELVGALLAPDLDLFDGTTYSPNSDGIADSLSLGLGFTATTATFDIQ